MQQGNQIFISVHAGKHWPPRVIEIRVKYEDKFEKLRAEISRHLQRSPEDILLLLRKKEITVTDDHLTISELEMHTGFSLRAWDMGVTNEAEIWPPMMRDENGRRYIE